MPASVVEVDNAIGWEEFFLVVLSIECLIVVLIVSVLEHSIHIISTIHIKHTRNRPVLDNPIVIA